MAIKLGVCLNMAARDADGLGLDLLPAVKEAGLDFIEMSVTNCTKISRERFENEVVPAIRNSGLPCPVMNAFSPPAVDFLGDPEGALNYAKEAFSRAAMLGVKTVVIGSGLSRSVPPEIDREDAKNRMAELFRTMADEAQKNGITLLLEGLNRLESNIFNTLEEELDEVQRVDHPAFRALVDYYHFTMGNENPAKLADVAKEIGHVHFSRMLLRTYPEDLREDAGYVPFLAALKNGGYDGTISLEAYCPNEFAPALNRAKDVLLAALEQAGY